MTPLPQVTVAYAWDYGHGESTGAVYDTREEALAAPAPRLVVKPIRLLRLYIAADGRIVHTEEEAPA